MKKQTTHQKIQKITKEKNFLKVKRKVLKANPGAYTRQLPDGTFEVCTANGYKIGNPELLLTSSNTVRDAWEKAALGSWFTGMIVKSFNAFNDEKIYRKLAKENKEIED